MILYPNCKINLGLNIIRKREDGYHDLETVFFPVGLKDALVGIRSKDNSIKSGVQLNCFGLSISGKNEDNLCVKAYHLLKTDFPNLPAVRLHLHKGIPIGAGMGGGSADGAFTLILLNQLFQLDLSEKQLMQYAFQLGSDCPFFILNKPCFATGRGEVMQEIELDLSDYSFIIVNPNIHISTAQAFSQIIPTQSSQSIFDIIKFPINQWKEFLVNGFEKSIFESYPTIAHIKMDLYEKGAVYASMTGSGSTVYGVFKKNNLPYLSNPMKHQIFYIK